jgi:primary-amine oxidase
MHPFDPLSTDEISRAATIVRPHFGSHEPNFRVITLQEPPKQEMIPYLDSEHRGQSNDNKPTRCARVEVVVNLRGEKNALFELLIDLDKDSVIAKQHQHGKHSYIDTRFMQQVEAACLNNKDIQDQICVLELPEGSSVVVEPWSYATDGENDMSKRLSMVHNS